MYVYTYVSLYDVIMLCHITIYHIKMYTDPTTDCEILVDSLTCCI